MSIATPAPAVPELLSEPKAALPARRKPTKLTAKQREQEAEGKIDKHWRTYFLQKLAETSNVTASAGHAGVATSRAYKTRREDPKFAAAWSAALFEGYQHLEMEVLGYLRAAEPDRKFDVANAVRLLAAHQATIFKATIVKERAKPDDEEDEQAVFDSIDAMIDEMRERSLANDAALAVPGAGDAQIGR